VEAPTMQFYQQAKVQFEAWLRDPACDLDSEAIRECVAETVIHEFGHHFGMSEEEIEEIEEKFWRGTGNE